MRNKLPPVGVSEDPQVSGASEIAMRARLRPDPKRSLDTTGGKAPLARLVTLTGAIVVSTSLILGSALAADAPSVLVQTTTIRKGSLPKVVNAYGTVQADPSARASVTAPLAAVVEKVFARPGQEVEKGGSLIQLTPNPQTSSSYAQAVSALQNAKDLLVHTKALYSEYLATKQNLANAEKAEADAQAALSALKAQGAAGPKIIKAPFNAVVTTVSASAGTAVDVGTPLLELAPPGSLVLQVGVIPSDAADIKVGNAATIAPVGETKTYSASVILRGAMVETSNGLVPVEIAVPPDALFPGETAQASIQTGTLTGYVVPHEAILVDDSGKPYIVQAVNMKAKIVPVHILGMDGNRNVIEGRINAKAPLVLAGNYQLQDGMKLRLADPPEKTKP